MLDATPLLRLRARRRVAQLAAQDPRAAQLCELRRLLTRAAETDFGRVHDFRSIDGPLAFRAAVPLARFEDLWRGWWQPAFPRLADVTWPGQPPFFALSSGTTSGSSKHVPVTPEMLRANTRAGLDLLCWHLQARPGSRALGGRSLMLGGSTALEALLPGVRAGDLSGIAAAELPWWARRFRFPPLDVALEPDWERKLARIAELAPEADIRVLTGTPSWVLSLFDMLADRGLPDAKSAFPNLELVVHGGVDFRPYRARFERWLAGSGAELREVYPASEAFIALADARPEDGLRLLVDNGAFFEFVPADRVDDADPPRLWLGEVATGVDYAIVLSTCAGLWGYVLGDIVRFTSLDPPRLIVAGRLGLSLSAFGEHLIGGEMEAAVAAAAAAVAVDARDWLAGPEMADQPGGRGRHVWLVEAAGLEDAARRARFAAQLDATLAELNDDYRAHRAAGVGIDPPEVAALRPGTVAQWMKARGRLGGQNKVPRAIGDPERFAQVRAELEAISAGLPSAE